MIRRHGDSHNVVTELKCEFALTKELFVLPPIHPVAYESLTDDPIPELAYNYFASFAKENNIPMLGSYNPAQCHLEKQDFEDDDHITMQGMIKLFKGIYCKQGEWSQFVE